jgi:hypothetical protein
MLMKIRIRRRRLRLNKKRIDFVNYKLFVNFAVPEKGHYF